jgi:photosystem II stability/assembly factor-like uncharacterized protein
MMKSMTKVLLVGAVAVMAIAVSAAPSEAAKRKHMKAPAKGTYIGQVCSAGGKVMVWGADMKWSPAVFTPVCASPFCPPAC